MKKHIWMKILAVGLITLVTVAGAAESAEQQKFKFGDLFKKTKPANTKKAETKSTEESEKKGEATKTEDAKATDSSKTTKPTTQAPKSKGSSNADRLKELTDKLNLSDTDPEALVRSARERMRAMQAKESSSNKSSSTKEKKASPAESSKPVVKAAPVAPPAKAMKTSVTAGEVKSAPKAAVVSRPPSLAPVSAVAQASAVTQRAAPPANLQASLAASGVPLPKPLVPEKLKKKNESAKGGVEITSDEAETDMAANTVIFIGNVELHEATFNLACDRLVVFMNDKGSESESQFKEAVATGAMVIVERINDKGEKDVGHSRKVVYDDRSGDIVLSGGPPVLQSGGGTVQTQSPDATIILKKDGNHRVKDRGKFTIPVKGKAGAKKAGPNLLPSKLGDISNRKN